MKEFHGAAVLCMLLAGVMSLPGQSAEFPELTGPYLGQKPPGAAAEPFALDLFTTFYTSHHTVLNFSPDGNEMYFHARERKESPDDPTRAGIFVSVCANGTWTKPHAAPFSTLNSECDAPFVTPDGRRAFFLMVCAADAAETGAAPVEEGRRERIFVVDRTTDGWSQPRRLPPVVNSMKLIHWGLSADSAGNLYFGVRPTMSLTDGYNGDIYVSRPVNGEYGTPEKLPPSVNIPGFKFSPYITPDGRTLLLTHIGHKSDHYKILVSFRKRDGGWTAAKEINAFIGLKGADILGPYISPDGKYFFFQYLEGNSPRFYWVDASFIGGMRPQETELR